MESYERSCFYLKKYKYTQDEYFKFENNLTFHQHTQTKGKGSQKHIIRDANTAHKNNDVICEEGREDDEIIKPRGE